MPKFPPALIVPSLDLIVPYPGMLAIAPLPVKIFTDKLAPIIPNHIPRNPLYCSFG